MVLSLQTCILIILLSAISRGTTLAVNNAGSFEKPASSSDKRINGIQHHLQTVQSEIVDIKAALESGDSFQYLKLRLSTLENQFQNLNQQLADEFRQNSASIDKHDSEITKFNNYYNTLDIQMKALEIMVVHDLYAKYQGNIDRLLNFAMSMPKSDLVCNVLIALRYEMRANGNHDPHQMMSVGRALENQLLLLDSGASDMRNNAQAVLNETIADLQSNVTETLKAAMRSGDYQTNATVKKLINAICDFRSEVFDEVMRRVVNELYPAVSALKIAGDVYNSSCYSQRVSGLLALFWKLKSANDLNNKAVIRTGDYLQRLTGMPDYSIVSEEKKTSINRVIENLPICVKNVLSLSTVCLWNRALGYVSVNWMGALKLELTANSYSWHSKRWIVQRLGDQFLFKSKASNGYLHEFYDSKDNAHYAFTSFSETETDRSWSVELDGDLCYLRNEKCGQYLYPSVILEGKEKSVSFAFKHSKKSIENPNLLLWQVRSC